MRKKNRYFKLLSIMLVLCLSLQSMTVFAAGYGTGESSSGVNGTSGNQPSDESAADRSTTTQSGKPSMSSATAGEAANCGVVDPTNGNSVFYRIGLAKLDNEEFQPYTDPDDLADAIQEYGKKY